MLLAGNPCCANKCLVVFQVLLNNAEYKATIIIIHMQYCFFFLAKLLITSYGTIE